MESGIEDKFSLSRARSLFLPDSRHSCSCFKMSISGILPAVGIQCRVMDLGFTYSSVVSAEVELVGLYP